MSSRRGVETKYTPLVHYLAALPARQQAVTLTFAELEALLGTPLPTSAGTTSFWFADATARSNWREQGWLGHLDRQPRAVTFTRLNASAAATPRSRTDRDAVIATYQQGATPAEMARRFGVSPQTILGILRRAGVRRRQRSSPGTRAP